MKTYTFQSTSDKDLFRVVDRNGDWTHYYHQPSDKYLRAVNFILETGYAKGYGLIKWLKSKTEEEAERILKSAGEKGDKIHQFINTCLEDGGKYNFKTTAVNDEKGVATLLSYEERDAILSFEHFWKQHDPEIIAKEYPIYDLKHKFAGTLDAIIKINKSCEVKSCSCKNLVGKIGLFDWKSGSGIYSNYGAQLAAYANGENLKDILGEHKIDYTAILRIGTTHKTTNGYQLETYDKNETKQHYNEFLSAITIASAEYKEFDPKAEIYDIPDEVEFKVKYLDLKAKKKKAKVAKKVKKTK